MIEAAECLDRCDAHSHQEIDCHVEWVNAEVMGKPKAPSYRVIRDQYATSRHQYIVFRGSPNSSEASQNKDLLMACALPS